jgi:hypothetical protein
MQQGAESGVKMDEYVTVMSACVAQTLGRLKMPSVLLGSDEVFPWQCPCLRAFDS